MKRFLNTASFTAVFLFSFWIFSCKSYPPAFNVDSFYSEYNDKIEFINTADYIAIIPGNKSPEASAENGIIFYPGALVAPHSYIPLFTLCAEEGITCYIVEMPMDFALFDKKAGEKFLKINPKIKHWYMAGHSLGGAIAASFISRHKDDFEGLILLSAYSTHDLSSSGLKVLSVYGSNDKVLNLENYHKNKKNLPPVGKGLTEIIIDGGNHAQFANYGAQEGDGTAEISETEQQKITAAEICNWIFEKQKEKVNE